MARKYIVKCSFPGCGRTFSSTYSRKTAIESMKRHAKRKHGVDYKIQDVKYTIKEVEIPEKPQ
jgi:predicted small metal-binding protein